MLNDEILNKVIERLTRRIEQGNTYVLEEIGKSIKKIGTLSPSKAQQLGQLIKYGGDYDKITKKLAEITKMNVKDIKKIFEEVAKNNYQFAKQFYDYRGKKFIPYEQNTALKTQVEALANATATEYTNISRTLAFSKVVNGKIVHTPLARAYQETLDKAILNVVQGKTTFQEEMYSTIKELASSGLKTIDYSTGRSMRLDSAVRMQMRGALRNLHNETQEIVGKEFDANMVEVSHHSNSAPDHIDSVDGKQFAKIDVIKEQITNGIEKEIKMEDIKGNRVKVKGKWYDDFDTINNNLKRHVSTLNCYHYVFSGILGINKPEFAKKELEEDKEKNLNGCEIDGKHYTLYEAQQLMRNLELELRKVKDEQIMGRASGIVENVENAQKKITMLTRKYNQVVKLSGLPSKLNRARVPGYRRVNIAKMK